MAKSTAIAFAALLTGGLLCGAGYTNLASASSGNTTTNLQQVGTYSGDYSFNYDFGSTSAASNNVDWALTIIFWNNADINKVENALNASYSSIGGPEYFYIYSSGGAGGYPGYYWDQDSRRKQTGCAQNVWYRHYRVYAPGVTGRFGSEGGVGPGRGTGALQR